MLLDTAYSWEQNLLDCQEEVSVQETETLFSNTISQNDLLGIVHAAAVQLAAAGYEQIFHVFLSKEIATWFDLTNVCYSPDNPSSIFFYAYHGSVDFSDIGRVLLTVEPYQAVAGCEVAPPNPSGELADSTNSVRSHELFMAAPRPHYMSPIDGMHKCLAYISVSPNAEWTAVTIPRGGES